MISCSFCKAYVIVIMLMAIDLREVRPEGRG